MTAVGDSVKAKAPRDRRGRIVTINENNPDYPIRVRFQDGGEMNYNARELETLRSNEDA